MAKQTHKDRVHEFNEKLESLSEHHDIPKVSPPITLPCRSHTAYAYSGRARIIFNTSMRLGVHASPFYMFAPVAVDTILVQSYLYRSSTPLISTFLGLCRASRGYHQNVFSETDRDLATCVRI